MSGRDMAWRSLGGLMTLGAVAATLIGPSESPTKQIARSWN